MERFDSRATLASDPDGMPDLGSVAKGVPTPVRQPLRVLIAEDFAPDAELEIIALKKADFDVRADVTENRARFIEMIRSNAYDVVLADYNLPQWTGLDVLQAVKDEGLDTPVILVTGAVGDEAAAECMKRGVADYVLKNRLVRLPQAIRFALDQ